MKRSAVALALAAALASGVAPAAVYATEAEQPNTATETPNEPDTSEEPVTDGTDDQEGAGDNSEQEVTEEEAVASVSVDNGKPYYVASFDDAIAAVAEKGGTINLYKDVTMTKQAVIKSDVVIVGGHHTITGVADNPNVNFKIDSGNFIIGYVTLDGFGKNAGTDSGITVIKVDAGKTDVRVSATGVNVSNFCRSAYDIRSGSFEINGGMIDCGLSADETSASPRLSKALVAGLGSTKVEGTIKDVEIKNSSSQFDDWDCGGIEIYQNSDVTIDNCTITGVDNGVSVDNYWAANGEDATGANVRISNSHIEANNDAIRLSSPESATDGKPTTVGVNGGTLIGDIAITGTSETSTQETISVANATVAGDIDNAGGAMTFVNSEITLDDQSASAPSAGITYVNTKVNGTEVQDTATNGEALLNGTAYATLEDAVKAAKSGDVITLLKDAVIDGADVANNSGILTFDNIQNVTIEGNGKTVTAENVETNTPSMINVVNNASVTIKNLTIDGKIGNDNKVKHGVNVWNKAGLTVENVTVNNCTGYAIVANSSSLMVNGLTTNNNGWGGINVDNSPDGFINDNTITINDATINESNSIKIEHSKTGGDTPVAINGGSFKSIVNGIADAPELKLTITGGTFKPAEGVANTIDINDYVADGLEWDSSTGTVQEKEETPDTPDTPVTPSKPSYAVNVTKPENGSIAAKPAKAKEGDKVTITVTPDKGFELVELTVTDKDGKAVKATLNDDGTYTFTMPKGAVSIAATFDCDGGELCPTHPFTDVDQDKWYHDAVDWAVENGVMRGYDNTTLFGPEDSHTREQAATVMWNIMGEGDLEAPAADLADVIQTEWYAPYVNWAYEAGIMRGYTGTDDFGVGDALSREQFAQIIVNATKADLSSFDTSVLDDFEDPGSVSPWAEKTMAWAVENGIIHGVDDTKLQGDRSITRAEMATMVKNAVDEGIISLAK